MYYVRQFSALHNKNYVIERGVWCMRQDLTGQRFGRLMVCCEIEKIQSNKKQYFIMIPNLFTKRQVNIYKYIIFNGISCFTNVIYHKHQEVFMKQN